MKKKLATAVLAFTLISGNSFAIDVFTPTKTIKKSGSAASASMPTSTQSTWTRFVNMFYGMFLAR